MFSPQQANANAVRRLLLAIALLVTAGFFLTPHTPTTSISELVFPGPTSVFPAPFPEHGCSDPNPSLACSYLGGFKMADYEGWSVLNGTNERMSFVSDSNCGGSTKTVARFEVRYNDLADHYGGVRANIWEKPEKHIPGSQAWFAFGTCFPSSFVWPDTWFLVNQWHHGDADSGNPPQSVELRIPPGGGSTRNYLWGKYQTDGNNTGTAHFYPAGPANTGHWHYFLAFIKFETSTTGQVRFWYEQDTKPDPTVDTPIMDVSGVNTLYTSAGFPSMLLYRDSSTNTAQIQVAYYCGFHRADSAVTALVLPNCP